MANIVEIIVRATAPGAQRGFNAVSTGLKQITKLAGLAGAAIASIFTTAEIKNAIDYATTIDDITRKLDSSSQTLTKFLSELQFVAQQNNVEFGTLTKGLQALARRLADAEQGAGPAVNSLKALGIQARDLAGLDLENRFLLIAEALSLVSDEESKVALATDLFSRSGVDLLRVTEDGAAGIEKLRLRARELGLTLDKEATAAAAQFGGELTEFQSNLDSLTNSIAQALLPILNKAAEGFRIFRDAIRIGNKEISELTRDEATAKLAKVQGDLAENSEKLLRVNRQLLQSQDLSQEEINKLADEYKSLTGSVIVLGSKEGELQARIESLTTAAQAQSNAYADLIGQQNLAAVSATDAAKAEADAATLRATLAQQQIDAESRITDLRRQNLTESERQRDIEIEGAKLTIKQVESLAKARDAETEQERTAALASAKAVADRLNALSSQATATEDQIKLTEEAARVQQEATKIEIAALDTAGNARKKQIKEARQEIDQLTQTKATIPISFDTSELDKQLAELRRILDELGANGISIGAGGSISGPAGFAAGGPIPGAGNRDTVPGMLTPGEFVVTKDGSNLADAAAFFAGKRQRTNNTGRFQNGGAVGSPDVVEIRINMGGRAHSMFGERSTANALASDLAALSRATQ